MILNGEMSEWLKEHTWKAKRASDIKRSRITSTHTRSATYSSKTIAWYASVNLDVRRGSKPHLSQFYHNRVPHLARVRGYPLVPVEEWRHGRIREDRYSIRSGGSSIQTARHSSGDDRLPHELELALRDPVQRQRLADYFAILQEWSLERQSAELISAQSREVSNSSAETARVSHRATVQPGTRRTASRANRQRTRRRS